MVYGVLQLHQLRHSGRDDDRAFAAIFSRPPPLANLIPGASIGFAIVFITLAAAACGENHRDAH